MRFFLFPVLIEVLELIILRKTKDKKKKNSGHNTGEETETRKHLLRNIKGQSLCILRKNHSICSRKPEFINLGLLRSISFLVLISQLFLLVNCQILIGLMIIFIT